MRNQFVQDHKAWEVPEAGFEPSFLGPHASSFSTENMQGICQVSIKYIQSQTLRASEHLGRWQGPRLKQSFRHNQSMDQDSGPMTIGISISFYVPSPTIPQKELLKFREKRLV